MVAKIDKDKGVNKNRTICEVHREIYDIISSEVKNKDLESKIVNLLDESYNMAKKMNAKLTQYKRNYDEEWWQQNKNFTSSLKIRKDVDGFFIDCGAWNGYSVEIFRKKYDRRCRYFIFSFEVNPFFTENFPHFDKHQLFKQAVWIYDGDVNFYIDSSKKRAGSTIIKEKTSGILDEKNPIKVKCIDLSKWIIANFNPDDKIILKLDIEGAEYQVLNKMIRDGSIDYIDQLFIEWHWNKIGVSQKEHSDLVKRIAIPIKERWKA
jgi:FkbM family methyltransferase